MARLIYRWLNVGETISHEGRAYRVLARPVPAKWGKVSIEVRDIAARTDTAITAPANAQAWRWR
ncbi:hypothetical protein [Amycolatopsis sp. NPDC102389]|uniref:hypothetical protein n=1 Tax=Amycolatopsis sp. NPDC102389 TaxID=3363941 RepID=UPI00382F835C